MNPPMFTKLVGLACLIASVSCTHVPRGARHVLPASSQISPQAVSAPGELGAKAASQQAKLHYVEIGPGLKGDYKFGYDTGSGPAGQSFREETRLDDGTVKGAYGYVDANGKQRIVKYTAGKAGFVVEDDAEAPSQRAAGSPAPAPARPEQAEVRRPLPVSLPQQQQQQQPQPQSQQAVQSEPVSFDEQPQFNINRGAGQPALPTAEDRARAEREHAEGLRQHQLAQQAALEQQQKLAQQLHLQQQQILAAQARQAPQQQLQRQQAKQQFAQPPQHQHQHHQQSQPQQQQQQQFLPPLAHQTVDPQTGSFFSSSNDANLNQLFSNQLRQLQSGQFQQPPSNQFAAQAAPAFQQAAPQFAPQPPAQQDFGQLRAARQAAATPHFPQQPQPQHHHAGAHSVLAALHQQQQQDAQLLAQLRAQHAARLQEQARQARVAQPDQQQQQQQFQAQAQPLAPGQQQALQRVQQPQPQAAFAPQAGQAVQQAAASQPQQETFGPPVIDIRTLNYSIGMQTRV